MNAQVQVPASTSPAQAPEVQAPEATTLSPTLRRAPLIAGGGVQAIVPRDIEQAYRLASAIVAADMAPKAYKRDANAVMVGILHGMEVGFTPMAALQSIAVINGMPSIWGDGALALIQSSGLLEDMKEFMEADEAGGWVAHCHMKRRGRAEWIRQKFSWADAKVAKLTGKDTYQQYGKRMLQRRARAWAMTDGFADVLRGLHIREVQEMGTLEEGEDGTYSAPTQQVIPPRPTRETTREEIEAARKADAKMNRQFRDTMREEPHTQQSEDAGEEAEQESGADNRDDNERADPATSEAGGTGAANQSPATPVREPIDGKALLGQLTEKVEKASTRKLLEAFIADFSQEIDTLRIDFAPLHDELMKVIETKRKWFAR